MYFLKLHNKFRVVKDSLGLEKHLEKAMVPHSSTLAWKIPWMEEPGGLQSTGLLRVGHDWATSLLLFTFMHWRRKCNPLQCSCLENPRGGGAWWAAVYGVAQSWTRLKWLSSSSRETSLLIETDSWKEVNIWLPISTCIGRTYTQRTHDWQLFLIHCCL